MKNLLLLTALLIFLKNNFDNLPFVAYLRYGDQFFKTGKGELFTTNEATFIPVIMYFGWFLAVAGNVFLKMHIERRIRQDETSKNLTLNSSRKGMELLYVLMPKFVIDRIQSFNDYGLNIADDAGEVTIIFCDISNFDEIVQVAQNDVVKI
jgi:hypothetical protein